MACECIQGVYDFDISVRDCKTLLYQDLSIWDTKPLKYTIDITVPNGSKRSLDAVVNSFFEINSINLHSTGEKITLQDGIYCFSVTNCETKYTKNWLNTCSLECCLDDYYSKVVIDGDGDVSDIRKISQLIKSAKYSANNNIKDRALALYNEAKVALEDLNCDCSCYQQ